MSGNSHLIIALLFLTTFLNAQVTVTETSRNKGNPDVVFKVHGGTEVYSNLMLDLPDGASFEHMGDGVFHITGMPDIYGFYKIGITAGGNLLNGVTTADMSLIVRHIMGNGNLANDLKMTAADVDCNGRITVFDVFQIRGLILDKLTGFGCDANYKFWPANLEFVWEGSRIDAGEYLPIKLGDVNGSAAYNSSY